MNILGKHENAVAIGEGIWLGLWDSVEETWPLPSRKGVIGRK